MQNAAFSITNYKFDKLTIDLSNRINNELNIGFNTSGVFISGEKSQYELTFTVDVFNNENKENSFISIQCLGVFEFENVNKFEEIPDFFYRNSIAILFPYVRAYISLVTTQANIPGVILPTLNLSELEEGLMKNTSQK